MTVDQIIHIIKNSASQTGEHGIENAAKKILELVLTEKHITTAPIEDRFIVGEVSKSWKDGEPMTNLLCQQFETVINVNAARGYVLRDWKIKAVTYTDGMTETIIAIFEKDL
jgi:hypothetical protein